MGKLHVAVIAPPWLQIPPDGYGGIEAVVDGLVTSLRDMDVDVELFSVGQTKIPGIKVHSLYKEGQYKNIHLPMYDVLPIAIAHLQFALNVIKADGTFDIIHDHNGFLGPFIAQFASAAGLPPIVHTVHGPPFSNQQMIREGLPDNGPMWNALASSPHLRLIGISESLTNGASAQLRKRMMPCVYNAIDAKLFPFQATKKSYFITLARFSREKAQHVAAKYCSELGYRLRMAGSVAGIANQKQLALELANPLSDYRNNSDFRYYSDTVLPITVNDPRISFVGDIGGERKLKFISEAKALLFPIGWDEPFGMAVIEALACGTPVVAMNRGAMPEIIEHGINGFLANTHAEFKQYMQRVDEIDPRKCRKTVEEKFSARMMASNYIDRYRTIIAAQ
jgi:glycosyltransferase involved in cell wall biosynthesis